ncbi:MAG TPA: beta-N-acetylglucosaminidase domain-containing protein [Myxococcota bacterium]|nr:beta-N-acetylglucosaminidase domain-containing protein [Myxococcota bacterium]HQK50027.1 beta-N-acetylglucosaminidase domain-containing protein [Myxococcota bacterium]
MQATLRALAAGALASGLLACASMTSPGCDPGPGADIAETDLPDDVPETPGACPPTEATPLESDLLPRPYRVLGRGAGSCRDRRPSTAIVAGLDPGEAALWSDFARRLHLRESQEAPDLVVRLGGPAALAQEAARCPPMAPPSDEAYRLAVSCPESGPVVAEVLATSPRGRRWALETLAQVLTAPPAREVWVDDAPAIPVRGVLETFYGPPWDPEDRLEMLDRIARMKMNVFVYGSKLDPYIDWADTYWRDEWPEEYLGFLSEMAARARDRGIEPGIIVKPLDQAIFHAEEDRALAADRLVRLVDLGFAMVALGFDDTPKNLSPADRPFYPDYDTGVLDFSRDVLERVRAARPGVRLGWVPNDYWSDAPEAPRSLPLAGTTLGPDVLIGWTGRGIVSRTIPVADAVEAAAWMGRRPLLGDNYPVIDHASARLNLGPLEGRDPGLPAHLSGALFNPMPGPWVSLPALATCADWAWNAPGYDPDRSLRAMARLLAGETGQPALETLARHDRSPEIAGSPSPTLEAAIAAFWTAWDQGAPQEAARVLRRDFLEPFRDVPGSWEQGDAEPSLKEAIRPWAEQAGRYGEAGLTALDLLDRLAAGMPPSVEEREAFRDQVRTAASFAPRPAGTLLGDFLDHALEILDGHPGIRR